MGDSVVENFAKWCLTNRYRLTALELYEVRHDEKNNIYDDDHSQRIHRNFNKEVNVLIF
jgi:hypothetical protein